MDIPNYDIANKLTSLKDSLHKARKTALSKRISQNPRVSEMEYFLGAFIEMYEPHLHKIVHLFAKKGYLVDISSGFCGKLNEMQAINGYIHPDYITKNKLEKVGVKLRDYEGMMSLAFWPESADLAVIEQKMLQIIEALPDKGPLTMPSPQAHAATFRMKYVPQDKLLQKKRLFERLLNEVQKEAEHNISNRKGKKIRPDRTELCLGRFVEELEIQTREAVILLIKKGYSVDNSGFMEDPCFQMIEGDFQLDPGIIQKIQKVGAEVETNASGYTRIMFSPTDANVKHITKQWMAIATLLPKRPAAASPSMTVKARNFRFQYAN